MKFLYQIDQKPISMKDAFIRSVEDAFFGNPNTSIVVGDIGHFGFRKIWENEEYKNRYFNLGILEQTMIGFSAGLSRAGRYPIVHTITPFLIERPFEQIKVDFGVNKLSGCFISVGGSYDYSTLGPTHHSYCDLALFSTIEDSFVYSVSSYKELHNALQESIKNKRLSYIRMNRNIHNFQIDSKNSNTIKISEGNDLTIVTSGGRLPDTIDALKNFVNTNMDVDLFYISRIKPLEIGLIEESIFKTGKLLVIEDHGAVGSLHSLIMSSIKINAKFEHNALNLSDKKLSGYGSYDALAKKVGLSSEIICERIKFLKDL